MKSNTDTSTVSVLNKKQKRTLSGHRYTRRTSSLSLLRCLPHALARGGQGIATDSMECGRRKKEGKRRRRKEEGGKWRKMEWKKKKEEGRRNNEGSATDSEYTVQWSIRRNVTHT